MPKSSPRTPGPAATARQPERWRVDAGESELAGLLIPPDAARERRFEISCAMTVRRNDGALTAWHALSLTVDGGRQWQRRVDTAAGIDGLDYRFERVVAPGQALRIRAEVSCSGAVRCRLVIEADEIAD